VKYKILSHTADLRLEVYGKTMEELFINAIEALAHILLPSLKAPIKTQARETIKIKSFNQNTLLVDFLNEVLSRSQINRMLYFAEKIKLADYSLEAELSGIKVNKFEEDVKAVTYHEAVIQKSDNLFKTRLVFDI